MQWNGFSPNVGLFVQRICKGVKKMMELWLPIKGYEGLYEISNMGNVRSVARIEKFIRSGKETQRLKAGRVLKPISRDEYLGVCLSKGTTRKCYLIHRLVAETFIENPLNFPQVNHKDEDKFNNRVTNLEWCTAEYNDNYGSRNNNISNSMRRKKVS